MKKEEMAKTYAEGFAKEYREIAYDAFLCGYDAKCSTETPNDLEEAAEKHSTDYDSTIWFVLESPNQKTIWKKEHKETFIAGAKWQKEQMLKEAVEGEYGYFSNASKTILPSGELNLKEGDKVRIIVCKNED